MKVFTLAGLIIGFSAMAQVAGGGSKSPINPACTSYFQCQAGCHVPGAPDRVLVSEGATKVEAFQSLQQQCFAVDKAAYLFQVDDNGVFVSNTATMTSTCVQATN